MTSTYLAVDMGYLFFYRYHATKLWYKKAKEYTDDLTMSEDTEFQNKFKDMIEYFDENDVIVLNNTKKL